MKQTSQLLAARRAGESGQATVESAIVIIIICLVFFGCLQVATLYNDERVLSYASFMATRSAVVGFQQEVYNRAYEVAAIPASGQLLGMRRQTLPFPTQKLQWQAERDTIPLYIDPRNLNKRALLNYEYWDPFNMKPTFYNYESGVAYEYHEQAHPLVFPMAGAYYSKDRKSVAGYDYIVDIPVKGETASHYNYYLQ